MSDTLSSAGASDLPGMSQAEAAHRLSVEGPNSVAVRRKRRLLQVCAEVLREPMFLLLLGAVALYAGLGDLAEAAFLGLGALATISLVVLQEARSERALAALKALAEPFAVIRRDGAWRKLPAAEIVRQDLVLVGEGARIPADGRLVSGDVLSIDESVLTGESAPVTRVPAPAGASASEASSLFAGGLVLEGQGVMEVTATGAKARLGGIGAALSDAREAPTPMQLASRRLVGRLGLAAGLISIVVLVSHGVLLGSWIDGTIAALTVAIALIPEEFPMVLAVFLAVGGWRMARSQVLVRRTAAVEALGAISVLCVDKTGTLTENQMQVASLWAPEAGRTAPSDPAGAPLLAAAVAASAVHGLDVMDRAVHAAAPGPIAGAPLRSYPLKPERLAFIQLWPQVGGVRFAAKGAPEAIFELCRLAEDDRRRAVAALDEMAREGLRVLGVAETWRDSDADPSTVTFEFRGLLGFRDPVRADVPPALAAATAAGVKVMMITGDFAETALAIARAAGLQTPDRVLTGSQIERMDDAALQAALGEVRVFARIRPDQKLRLVHALQAAGERVGMFGDGVNDAPALQAADVGVAMGLRGVDVAREASDIILLDDRFASVVSGIAEGRRIYANLQAALTFLLIVHVPMAGLALLPPLLGVAPILFPMQVVLLELLIDPTCAFVFEARRAREDAMRQPPRPTARSWVSGRELARAVGIGGLLLLAPVMAHLQLLDAGFAEPAARGAALAVLIGGNLGAALLLGVEGRLQHRQAALFGGIAAIALCALTAALYLPWLAQLFRVAPLEPGLFMGAVSFGLAVGGLAGAIGRAGLRAPARRPQRSV